MSEVVALGELLIDFTPAGYSENGNILFERNPGGAPGNVLALLSKLDIRTSFIGKVGNDQFGKFLSGTLDAIGIDTEGLVFTDEVNTTLAFVHLQDCGDRSFSFYRNPGADMMLTKDEVNDDIIKKANFFHFGSISMIHEPSKSATLKAVKCAKENNLTITYDPNLRPPLWNDLEEAKKVMCEGLEFADILKISEEELEFITGIRDLEKGTKFISDKYNIPLILVTLGEKGSFYRRDSDIGYKKGYKIKTLDTTGAGDAFLGAIIYKLIKKNKSISKLTVNEIEEIVDFANASGALTTKKTGAIPAMPSLEEINDLIK